MTSRLVAAVVLLALAFCPAGLFAEKAKTKLTVQVLDVKDRPIPRASITLVFVSGTKLGIKDIKKEWNLKTSSKGIAEVPEIPSGKVRLTVIAAGYQTYGDEFEISGEELTHTVKLERPSGKQFSAHDPAPIKPDKKP
jgi:hypothetical protein